MAKQIKFTYNDTDYVLEFTRRTVKDMEAKGFNINEVPAKPVTMLPKLFAGAFMAHHPTVKRAEIDKMYALFPDRKKLIECLGDMYADPMNALIDEPECEPGETIAWDANWEIPKEDE